MLRKIRIVLALLFFVAVTALFLDFTGTVHAWIGWVARIQFFPAILALNFGVVLLLVLLTLVAGRVYCSVICPLGVFQDIISWVSGRRKKKKLRFSWSPEVKWLRYGVLTLFIIALVAGAGSVAALLEPYSAYGRIATNFFAPVYAWGNNFLAWIAERADSYAFYETEVWLKGLPTLLLALATLIAVVVLSWRSGRTYCNTICPVGTILGFFSRFSFFRPVIDAEKCKDCSLCSRGCKASCIDYKHHNIDYSRCVSCMDCLETCKHDALHLQFRYKKVSEPQENVDAPDKSRRSFLTVATAFTATAVLKAEEKKVDGGLAVIQDKKVPERKTHIAPAGALSLKHFSRHCTACQLCVAVCPNGVLRPSSDLSRLMQPEVSYERGYCRPECTKCSEVCPAGAIVKIDRAEKSSIRIGHAVWVAKNCVPLTDGVECGNCARHCPSGAIMMAPSHRNDPDSVKIPIINTERCIGCGACENLCPARPFSAIYVEGHEVHSEM